MTASIIWNRRNSLKFGRPAIPVTNIIPRAGSLLQEFVISQEVPDEPPSLAVSTQWHPPEFPYYEANFDAAVFKASSSAGIGVIIRDNKGDAIGALSVPTPLSTSVAAMEALACRRAVLFAKEIGLRQVLFEGDSAMVIQALIQGDSASAEYGNIIDDIRTLAADFDFCHFIHVKRNCNVVADAVAKKAKILSGLAVWLEDVPEDIAPLLLFDVP